MSVNHCTLQYFSGLSVATVIKSVRAKILELKFLAMTPPTLTNITTLQGYRPSPTLSSQNSINMGLLVFPKPQQSQDPSI